MPFSYAARPWSSEAALNAVLEAACDGPSPIAIDRAQEALQVAFDSAVLASAARVDAISDLASDPALRESLRFAARSVRDILSESRSTKGKYAEPAVWRDQPKSSSLVTVSGRVIGRVHKTIFGRWTVEGALGHHIAIRQPTRNAAKAVLQRATGYTFGG